MSTTSQPIGPPASGHCPLHGAIADALEAVR